MFHYGTLVSFVAVYRMRSLTRAAQMLKLSQPAISSHIKSIEGAVGRPLFVRGREEVIPTQPGRALAHRLMASVDKLDSAWEAFAEPHAPISGPIRVGAHAGILNRFFIPSAAALADKGIVMHLVPGKREELLEQFENKKIDLLISTFLFESAFRAEYVAQETFQQEQYLLVGSPAWAQKIDKQALTQGDTTTLSQADWLLFNTKKLFVKQFIEEVFRKPLPLKIVMTFPEASALLAAVIDGLGITVLPDFLCRPALESGELVELYQPPRPPLRPLYFVYERRTLLQHRIEAVIAQLKSPAI